MKYSFYLRKALISHLLLFFMVVASISLFAQNISHLESQLQSLEGDKKAKVQLELSQAYLQSNQSKSIDYALEALAFGKKNNVNSIKSYANLLLGQAYYIRKDYSKAYDFATKSVGFFINNDLDNFYVNKELLGDISFEQKNFGETVKHLEKAFEYYDENSDHKNAGFVASKMGSSYERLNNYKQATSWHKKAFESFEQSRNIREMIVTQSILGGVYSNYGDYRSAKIALNTAYDLAITHGLIDEFETLKERLRIVSKNAESEEYTTTDFERDQSKNQKEKLSEVLSQRAKTLEEIEKLSEEKQLVELKIKLKQDEYEKDLLAERLEKLEIERLLKQEKLEKRNLELALDNERLESEKKTIENQRLFISIGALLLTTVLIFLALLIKNKSNRKLANKNIEIQRQKEEIEEKQENINQSISYASRIQEAILPSTNKLVNNFSEGFVYLNPKDQVSGDFLWTYEDNGVFFICVADCTGHGVPGAFMSIIFNNLLDEIVKKEGLHDPAEILERASNLLFEKVKGQERDLSSFKDGMDAVLLRVDSSKRNVLFSGAKNGLILVRDNELNEYKGARRSIDTSMIYTDSKVKFTSEKIELQKNDVIYLFTDGFVDQKGGLNNSKFYRKNFRKLLNEISNETMNQQKSVISNTFNEWKKNNEQIDDVLIVAFRL